jgi:hypothetical protein
MGYIKVDKSNSLPSDLAKAVNDFSSMTSSLSSWIDSVYNVSYDRLYKEE